MFTKKIIECIVIDKATLTLEERIKKKNTFLRNKNYLTTVIKLIYDFIALIISSPIFLSDSLFFSIKYSIVYFIGSIA